MFREALIYFVIGKCAPLEKGWHLAEALILCQNLDKAILESLDQESGIKLQAILRSPEKQRDLLKVYQEQGIQMLTLFDESYPKALLNMEKPPIVLFYKGDQRLLGEKGLALVSRDQVSLYAETIVKDLTQQFQAGHIITSALSQLSALVYESLAHQTNGQMMLMATGFQYVHPIKYLFLQKRLEKKGLVITELPFDSPFKSSYLVRHRQLLAGLASAVCLVEADKQDYVLLTAYAALEQSKDVIVPPGNLYQKAHQGSNNLLQEGALLLLEMNDVNGLVRNSRI